MQLRITYFLALTALLCSGFALLKEKAFLPPGTIKINDSLFFDEAEVSNKAWKEYVSWQLNKHGRNSKEYMASLPDSTVWLNLDSALANLYYSHPSYNSYPVVGIRYSQALAYSKWRTQAILEMLVLKKEKNPKTHVPKKFTYRLPSRSEWEMVAEAGFSEKTQKIMNKKYPDLYRHNLFRPEIGHGNDTVGLLITEPSYSYWPNSYGVYNIIGNVAEMILEDGVAKGGSWVHLESEVTVSMDFSYDKPKKWLGFRNVCVIEEK